MKSKTFTPEQMNERLARFDDLKPTQKAFVDSLIPGMERDVFTVIGVGDMSGDVFGNGMLQSKHTKLLAAFNHNHIFINYIII